MDRVDTNHPLSWASQDAMAPSETRWTVWLGFTQTSRRRFDPAEYRFVSVPPVSQDRRERLDGTTQIGQTARPDLDVLDAMEQ